MNAKHPESRGSGRRGETALPLCGRRDAQALFSGNGRRLELAMILIACFSTAIVTPPIVAATTYSPAYGNSSYTPYVWTGGLSAQYFSAHNAPNQYNGQLVFWHNVSVGQRGPTNAEYTVIQGFRTTQYASIVGSHSVSMSWTFNAGKALEEALCYSSTGAASMSENESVLFNAQYMTNGVPGAMVFANDFVQVMWTHSLSSNCPTGNTWNNPLSGTFNVNFGTINFGPSGGNMYFWGYLYTNTTAVETTGNDVWAMSCIDYSTSGGCDNAANAYAELNSITVI